LLRGRGDRECWRNQLQKSDRSRDTYRKGKTNHGGDAPLYKAPKLPAPEENWRSDLRAAAEKESKNKLGELPRGA